MLVAVSIPIFNSQLRKSRLATNQANARAAYAAAVATLLDKDATTDAASFDYAIKTATLTSGETAGTVATPITDWKVETNVGVVLGDTVADIWHVTIKDGDSPKFLGEKSS